ncbi:MAG: thioredoxin domain-containing protein [Terriglobia bacterium]
MLKKFLVLVPLVLVCASVLAAQTAPTPAPTDCIGDPDAPIVLEVFSDFQCPACRQYYLGTIQPLLSEYVSAGSVCLIYRDLPLRNHAYARPAALHAAAAARIGQWLRVTQTLYGFQDEWAKDGNVEAVVMRGLPEKARSQLRRVLKDPKLGTVIDRDIARARRLGVRSTPTSLLTANGQTQRITGVVPYAILKRYLDHLLGK